MGTYLDRTYDGVLGPEPYRAYVPHGIAGWAPEIGEDAARRVKAAADRLEGLRARMPQHRALWWCLNRCEGIASSDVEGISTTLKSLSLLESLRARRDPQRQERDRQTLGAVRLNAHAIEVGRRAGVPVEVGDLLEMHRRLFEGTGALLEPSRLRNDDVWIGAHGATPPEALFVAAPAPYVGPLIEDLTKYVSAHDLRHPLVKAAVAHLQFETVHPFPDGNGRVGRALAHCVLQRGWPGSVPVPLSVAVSGRKQRYYQALRPYQTYTGDRDSAARSACAEAAVAFVADAATIACDYTEAVAEVVTAMHSKWSGLDLRPHSAAAAALEAMSTMPAVTVEYLCDVTGRPPHGVRRGLRKLVSSGVVAETHDDDTGHRVFELPEMLEVVDHRSALVRRCWEMHEAGFERSAPDIVDRWHQQLAADQSLQPQQTGRSRCTHIGKRSGVRCTQGAGHAPPHRYT